MIRSTSFPCLGCGKRPPRGSANPYLGPIPPLCLPCWLRMTTADTHWGVHK